MTFEIIGEKINGTRKRVRAAIDDRDAAYIGALARSQAEAGADWIDINAGTHPEREVADLAWLVETVQAHTDKPLCLDSPSPPALAAAIGLVRKPPIVNSISGEPERRAAILELVTANGASVVALAVGAKGMPVTVDDRLTILAELVGETRAAGIPDERVYLDPLVMTVGADMHAATIALESIRSVRATYPDAHITCGLSNVSFGLPARGLLNRSFLTLAVAAGLDTAIVDPLDRELGAALLATNVLLGRDRHCLNYTRAFRAGQLSPTPPAAAPQPVVA